MKKLFNLLFNYKKINSKQLIEQSMSEKYGSDQLEQCMNALRNPEVREELRKDLKLTKR